MPQLLHCVITFSGHSIVGENSPPSSFPPADAIQNMIQWRPVAQAFPDFREVGDAYGPQAVAIRSDVFRAAKRQKLIESNPFAEVTAKAVLRQNRQRFITHEETEQLLAVCNPTWKVVVALCRMAA